MNRKPGHTETLPAPGPSLLMLMEFLLETTVMMEALLAAGKRKFFPWPCVSGRGEMLGIRPGKVWWPHPRSLLRKRKTGRYHITIKHRALRGTEREP